MRQVHEGVSIGYGVALGQVGEPVQDQEPAVVQRLGDLDQLEL